MEARSAGAVVDPSRETRQAQNTRTFELDNGLSVRLQMAATQIGIQLIDVDGTVLGMAGATTYPSRAGDTAATREVRLREEIYEMAKRLQPLTMEDLAAIRATVFHAAGKSRAFRPG